MISDELLSTLHHSHVELSRSLGLSSLLAEPCWLDSHDGASFPAGARDALEHLLPTLRDALSLSSLPATSSCLRRISAVGHASLLMCHLTRATFGRSFRLSQSHAPYLPSLCPCHHRHGHLHPSREGCSCLDDTRHRPLSSGLP